MNACMLKSKKNFEKEERKKDICVTCFKRPLCPIRMKGGFHLAQCTHYLKAEGAVGDHP